MDSFPKSEIEYQTAHLDDDNGTAIAVVGSVFVVLAIISVVLRVVARRSKQAKLAADDYLAIGTVIPLLVLDVASNLSVRWGLGRHLLWVLQDPENIVNIGKVQLGISLGYNFSMLFGKLSVLALYHRVFTFATRFMKWGVISTGALTVLWFTTGTLGVFLECRPLYTIWTESCLPSKSSSIVFAAVNFATDIVVLVLPQRVIWKLNRSPRERLAISGLFLLGIFATAVTLTRLVFFNKSPGSEHPYDSTYYSSYTILFTVAEPACVVLCGSLPMIPGLIRSWIHSSASATRLLSFTKYWPSTRGRSQGSGWSKTGEVEPREHGSRGLESRDHAVEGSFKKSSHSTESTEMFSLEPGRNGRYHTEVGQAI